MFIFNNANGGWVKFSMASYNCGMFDIIYLVDIYNFNHLLIN